MTTNGESLKSSYELAMERLNQKHGPVAKLSAEQKAALADVDSKMKADLAETEIVMGKKMAEARAAGDLEGLQKLDEQKRNYTRKIQDRAEEDRAAIRGRT